MKVPLAQRQPTLRELRALVFRAPIDVPVRTSFGMMFHRPMLLVRVEDGDGAVGWGEVWCNFPACGDEHRANLIETVLGPMLCELPVDDPPHVFEALTQRTRVLAIQSGEPGPLAQCIAGIDLALWDLAARRVGKPLYRILGGSDPNFAVYASGLNPDFPEQLASRKRAEGHRAFKLKVGFGLDRDIANLRALRTELGDGCALMVDANQGWTLDEALLAVDAFIPFSLAWIEEPLAADAPPQQWQTLASRSQSPLAAGENIASRAEFETAIAGASIGVVQPDVAKWGGLSGCAPIARAVTAAGKRFCPHFLGGGVGLVASAHLLAAVGGDGSLEIDANDNPLRTLLAGTLLAVVEGRCMLAEAPGLGFVPDRAALAPYLVLERVIRR